MEEFIGRRVEMKVREGSWSLDGGGHPVDIFGIVNKIDGDFITITVENIGTGGLGGKRQLNNPMIINRHYVVYVIGY